MLMMEKHEPTKMLKLTAERLAKNLNDDEQNSDETEKWSYQAYEMNIAHYWGVKVFDHENQEIGIL